MDLKRTASTILVRQPKLRTVPSPLHRDDQKIKKASELQPSIEAEDSESQMDSEDSVESTQLDLTEQPDSEMHEDADDLPNPIAETLNKSVREWTLANKWDAFEAITERMVDDWIQEAGPNILSVKLKRKIVLDTPTFKGSLKRKRSVPAAGVKVLTKLAKRFRSK